MLKKKELPQDSLAKIKKPTTPATAAPKPVEKHAAPVKAAPVSAPIAKAAPAAPKPAPKPAPAPVAAKPQPKPVKLAQVSEVSEQVE